MREGDRVATGQRLADVGSTGSSSGPHLHFEIWSGAWYGGGHAIDPLPDLKRWDRLVLAAGRLRLGRSAGGVDQDLRVLLRIA